jgi:ADP-ribose pyrophosphatase
VTDDALREEVIASAVAFDGRLLKVRVDTVRLADGVTTTREIVGHPGAVALVPLLDDRVLFVRQWRSAAGCALLEIPAGTLDAGEDPRDCAARELMEECGYRPGLLSPLAAVYLAPGYSSELIHLYLAEDLTPERLAHDEDERLEVEALTWEQIDAGLRHGAFADAKTITGLLLAERVLRGRQAGA